jgi:hypothetical protein
MQAVATQVYAVQDLVWGLYDSALADQRWWGRRPDERLCISELFLSSRQFYFPRASFTFLAPVLLSSRQFYFSRASFTFLASVLLSSRQFYLPRASFTFLAPVLLSSRRFFFSRASFTFLAPVLLSSSAAVGWLQQTVCCAPLLSLFRPKSNEILRGTAAQVRSASLTFSAASCYDALNLVALGCVREK